MLPCGGDIQYIVGVESVSRLGVHDAHTRWEGRGEFVAFLLPLARACMGGTYVTLLGCVRTHIGSSRFVLQFWSVGEGRKGGKGPAAPFP